MTERLVSNPSSLSVVSAKRLLKNLELINKIKENFGLK